MSGQFKSQIHNLRYRLLFVSLTAAVVLVLVGTFSPAQARDGLLMPAAVPNDDFNNAVVVTAVPYSTTQDIFTATVAADDPTFACASGQRYNTVWYRFTPATADTLVFSTDGSKYSLVLGIWTGTRGSLTSQACGNGTPVQLAVNAGTTYYIELARSADYISPPPTSINSVLSIYPASTLPAAFSKSAPANGEPYQSTRPVLKWNKSVYASAQAYCYDTTNNDTCDTNWITTTQTSAALSGLNLGTMYYWQVRAANSAGMITADNGTWWSFTTARAADLNHWTGTSGTGKLTSMDVLTDGTHWLNFSLAITYDGCTTNGKTATILVGGSGAITNRAFSYHNDSNSYTFSGAFTSLITATGHYQLNNYALCDWIPTPGYCCWVGVSGSGTWAMSGPALPAFETFLPLVLRN